MDIKTEKLKLLADYCIAGNILDVGFAARPNPFLRNAIGLDIILPKDKPENYTQAIKCNLNIENIPLEKESFDNVIAGDVIEHLENPSHFLRECNRVLKQSGRLIISTPHANDWWTTLHNWFFRGIINDPDPGEHLQNWTIIDMFRLLRKNGFKIEKIEGFYMHFPKINFRIRVRYCPILSWQIFYIAKKIGKFDKTILTHVNKECLNVEQ